MQGNLSLSTTCAALRAARARNLRTVVNPAPIQYSYERIFPLTDVALLNEVEARELGGGDDAIAAARAIHESGVGTVIVTLGAQGAMAISRSGRERMSAPSVAAVDTVGAGDVFCGALVACLAAGPVCSRHYGSRSRLHRFLLPAVAPCLRSQA